MFLLAQHLNLPQPWVILMPRRQVLTFLVRAGLAIMSWGILSSCFAHKPINEPIKSTEDWAKANSAYFVDYDFNRFGVTEPGSKAVGAIEFPSAPVTDSDIEELAQLKPEVYRLGLPWAKLTDRGSKSLSGIQSLRSLTLANNTGISDESLKYFARLKHLRYLDLSINNISDTGIAKLGELRYLKRLDLNETKVKGYGFKGFDALQELKLSRTPVDSAGLKVISQLKLLNTLELHETKIVDSDLGYLSGMPEMAGLVLSNTAITDSGVTHLAPLAHKLQVLYFDGTKITDASIKVLSKMKRLTFLSVIETNITEKGFETLQLALPEAKIRSDYGVAEGRK